MKSQYADRICPHCNAIIPGEKKRCPVCHTQVGRVNINPEAPGSYKGYIKAY